MTTNYPAALDAFTNPTAGGDTAAPVTHSSHHANANDAIEAIEAKVGIGATAPAAGTTLEGSGAGASAWTKQAMCRAYHDSNQSISNMAVTKLSFNQERYDTDTMHDLTTNNGRITIKTAGRYHVGASAEFLANASGVRLIDLLVNNAIRIAAATAGPMPAGEAVELHVATDYTFAVNDYIEVRAYQSSGASLAVVAAPNWSPEFFAHRIGA